LAFVSLDKHLIIILSFHPVVPPPPISLVVTVEPPRLTLTEGSNGTIKCSVHSSAHPVIIEWYIQQASQISNQHQVGPSIVITMGQTGVSFLRIFNATFSDNHGSYYCRASAQGKQHISTFFVDVQCK